MAFNAKQAGGGNDKAAQSVIEPGSYPARLVQLIDIGLQPQRAFQGTPKPPIQEIHLTYELVDVFMADDEGNDIEDKPRWVSETIPFHNLEAAKAKSTQRYNAFDPKGDYDGDFTKALGDPINVVLVNNAVGDKTYTNVAGLSPMRPKEAGKCTELKNPISVFSLDEPDMAVYAKLPKWIQEKIGKNLNFKGSPLDKALNGGKAGKPAKEEPADEQGDDDNSPY
jgi:hypothetical protein